MAITAENNTPATGMVRRICKQGASRALGGGLALFVCLHLLGEFFTEVSAQEKRDPRSELQDVRKRIEREEERIETIRRRQSDITKTLTQMAEDDKRIEEQKVRLSTSVGELESRIKQLETTVNEGRQIIEQSRTALGQRVVAIYKMHRRAGSVLYLSQASSATNLLKRANYLARITAHDRARLEKIDLFIANLTRERTNLEEARVQREESLRTLSLLEKQVETQRVRQASLLDAAKEEEKTQLATLANLQSSAEELEQVLSSIMGSEEVSVTPSPTIEKHAPALGIPDTTPYLGPGLGGQRGQLLVPVEGSVIQRFGKQKHEEFADMVFVKGLEFNARPGARVSAVAAGKVVLNQVLPGFGNVVIVDHGERYYTLYGRLASGLSRVGDVVKKGEVVGVVGEPDKRNRNFYFELRIKGKPVDPLAFFKDKPTSIVG